MQYVLLMNSAANIVACQTCGLVQQVDEVPKNSAAKCARCDFKLFHRLAHSRDRTIAFSLAALILYFPANLYPLITADYQGQHTQTTVFQGIKALFAHEQYFIAGLVFCTSIFTPALKIIGLLFISLTLDWPRWKKGRAWVYKVIRVIDPWNMLEVFLLAIGVALVELTLLATLSFDPRLLWDSPAEEKSHE